MSLTQQLMEALAPFARLIKRDEGTQRHDFPADVGMMNGNVCQKVFHGLKIADFWAAADAMERALKKNPKSGVSQAVYDWVREDVGITIKMVLTLEQIQKLEDKITAATLAPMHAGYTLQQVVDRAVRQGDAFAWEHLKEWHASIPSGPVEQFFRRWMER